MIPVEGHKNLFRDPETGAILDNDTNAYSQYINKKNRNADQKAELDEMKKDIDEIKSLLQQLVNHKA
tara:strand:+ start:16395 stop:16595 length:201 start_codon:yes stop_codon:yes gene_type:complete